LDMYSEVGFAAAGCGAQLALEHRLVSSSVNQPVGFQTVALGKPGMAHITLVRLFTSVNAEMAFQLERIWASICAVRALEHKF